jgi:hypothetical protein
MSGWQRFDCLKSLGHTVVPFDQEPYIQRAFERKTFFRYGPAEYDASVLAEFNRDILATLVSARPHVAWFEWPFLLRRETLTEAAARLPGCVLVSFQDDNPFGTRWGELRRWRYFLDAIPAYDLQLVKRPSDVMEFSRRGARRAWLFRHGCYTSLFRPLPPREVPSEFCQEVSFVGTPLDNRVQAISELLIRHRFPLRVFGGRWERTLVYYRRHASFRSPALGEDYVRVICGSKISLGFVSASNHDEYTMRTFEIPACRGFLLAQRTPAHQELFAEGKEAEFFDSIEECADKIRFYLSHENLRQQIAEGGYRRCLESDYSLSTRLAEAMEQVEPQLAGH